MTKLHISVWSLLLPYMTKLHISVWSLLLPYMTKLRISVWSFLLPCIILTPFSSDCRKRLPYPPPPTNHNLHFVVFIYIHPTIENPFTKS